jgi:hypothetical protein
MFLSLNQPPHPMPAKTITKKSTSPRPSTSHSARLTFTFSKSKELEKLVYTLEHRLSGLSRAEIVKLALIELNNTLLIRDKNTSQVEYLSEAHERELIKSKDSGFSHELKSPQDIDAYLEEIIKY